MQDPLCLPVCLPRHCRWLVCSGVETVSTFWAPCLGDVLHRGAAALLLFWSQAILDWTLIVFQSPANGLWVDTSGSNFVTQIPSKFVKTGAELTWPGSCAFYFYPSPPAVPRLSPCSRPLPAGNQSPWSSTCLDFKLASDCSSSFPDLFLSWMLTLTLPMLPIWDSCPTHNCLPAPSTVSPERVLLVLFLKILFLLKSLVYFLCMDENMQIIWPPYACFIPVCIYVLILKFIKLKIPDYNCSKNNTWSANTLQHEGRHHFG